MSFLRSLLSLAEAVDEVVVVVVEAGARDLLLKSGSLLPLAPLLPFFTTPPPPLPFFPAALDGEELRLDELVEFLSLMLLTPPPAPPFFALFSFSLRAP